MEIRSGGSLLATVFSASVGANGNYADVPWTHWSHTATAAAVYTIKGWVYNQY